MVAITILTISIIAPMALTVQSLESAYYARDEITAENLAQEGIEAVRSIRDGNILLSAEGTPTSLFNGIIRTGRTSDTFTIDAHTIPATVANYGCSPNCPALQTNGTLYGYGTGWTNTQFTRTITVIVLSSASDGTPQELRVASSIVWKTGSYATHQFTVYEDMYNWINPGSATP
jgi:Tfp pilus assembly protein PilV